MPKKVLAILLALVLFPLLGQAQAFPNQPITLVLPGPPGGAADAVARLIAEGFKAELGQSVVMNYKPGATYRIAASLVARAKPDGYTLLLAATSTYTFNPLIFENLPYDPVDGFEHIAITGGAPLLIVANKESGIDSLSHLVTRARSAPGTLAYGTFGVGSSTHVLGEMLSLKAKIKLLHSPFKGTADSLTALLGNQIPFAIDTWAGTKAQIQAGKVKALAQTGAQRSPFMPDVPTVAESGFPDVVLESWFGIVAPKGTPDEVVKRLTQASRAFMAKAETKEKLAALGYDSRFADGTEFKRLVKEGLRNNEPVLKAAGIKQE